jgi:hypothetical protein
MAYAICALAKPVSTMALTVMAPPLEEEEEEEEEAQPAATVSPMIKQTLTSARLPALSSTLHHA